MQRLVRSVQVNSVADLYDQYQRFARSYSLADNPLYELTVRIPRSAEYYAVVPVEEAALAQIVMEKLAGRRKLHILEVDKDEIRYSNFSPVDQMFIYYV